MTSTKERFLFFQPGLNHFQFDGIVNIIIEYKMDVSRYLSCNICLSGENAMLEGRPERVKKEVIRLAPEETKVQVVAAGP